MKKLLSTFLAWTTVGASPALAFRPFDGQLAELAEPGELSLELGPLALVVAGAERALVLPQAQLDWGIGHDWALVGRARPNVPMGGEHAGNYRLEGGGLAIKRLLRAGSLQGEPGPSLAVEGGLVLPTAGSLEPGTLGVGAAGLISHDFGPLTLGADVEGFYTRTGQFGGGASLMGLGPGWQAIRPVVEATIEDLYGEAPGYAGLLGLLWQPRKDLGVDAALRVGFEGAEPEYELRMGLTWKLMLSSLE